MGLILFFLLLGYTHIHNDERSLERDIEFNERLCKLEIYCEQHRKETRARAACELEAELCAHTYNLDEYLEELEDLD